MAAIELGTWHTRAGYIGDVACTRSARSLTLPGCPEEIDLTSLLNRGTSTTGKREANEEEEEESLVQLWTLRNFQTDTTTHINYLRAMKRDVLGCRGLDDPLTLVVPELWHERLDVIKGLFELVLEDGEIANALYCTRPSVCWALASGKASAVVLDVGHSHTTVTGVLDGYALRHSVDTSVVGGATVTAQFAAMASSFLNAFVEKQHPTLAAWPDRRQHFLEDQAADVKHLFGFVSTGDAPSKSALEAAAVPPLRAPDGATLSLTAEQRSAPYEIYFGGSGSGGASGGFTSTTANIAEMLARCKRRTDPEWQVRTVHHVLAGAGSRVRGFPERLVHDLKEKDAAYFRYERDGALTTARSAAGAWIGASMAAASSSFDPLWVTRAEWEEEGESVLYRKLFY